MTPFRVASLVSVVALTAVSVIALVIAVRSTGAAQSLPADASRAPLSDAADSPVS